MWYRKFSFLTKRKDVRSSKRSILRRSSYVRMSAVLKLADTITGGLVVRFLSQCSFRHNLHENNTDNVSFLHCTIEIR